MANQQIQNSLIRYQHVVRGMTGVRYVDGVQQDNERKAAYKTDIAPKN